MNILLYLLEKYPEKPWDWYWISKNTNLAMDIIEKNPEKPWDWGWISKNTNITMDIIEMDLHHISFSNLSKNKFAFENTRMKKKEGYLLLEQEYTFHKLQNLYVINQYM